MVGFGPPARRQARREWWRRQIRRQKESSLTVAGFCRRLGVSTVTFYAWKRRFRGAPPASPAFLRGPRRGPFPRPMVPRLPPSCPSRSAMLAPPGNWRSNWPMPASYGSRGPSILDCSASPSKRSAGSAAMGEEVIDATPILRGRACVPLHQTDRYAQRFWPCSATRCRRWVYSAPPAITVAATRRGFGIASRRACAWSSSSSSVSTRRVLIRFPMRPFLICRTAP
jgi:hypothetical protein